MSLTPDVTFYHPLEGKCSCGVDFSQAKPKGWEKRQVFDLPPLEIVVTEHCAEKKQCVCGINHRAAFPTGVIAPVQYGPRIRGMGVYLLTVQLLPYERTTQTLSDLLSVDLSEGSLDHFLETAYQTLKPVEECIKEALKEAPVLHADETGVSTQDDLRWWHVASTASLTHYHLSHYRGAKGFQEAGILNSYTGFLVHDAYSAYWKVPAQHALCNAHLLRDLERVKIQFEQPWATEVQELLRAAKLEVEAAVPAAVTETTIQSILEQFKTLLSQAKELNPGLERTDLERAERKRGKVKQSFARNLVLRLETRQGSIWRFLTEVPVPFDNNQAERDVRMVKLKNKISGISRGTGMVRFARIKGYLSSLAKQGVNLLAALESVFRGSPILPKFT